MESNTAFDPGKGFDLRSRVLLRFHASGVDKQILTLLQTACDQALAAEGVALSQREKNRLIKEMARSILTGE